MCAPSGILSDTRSHEHPLNTMHIPVKTDDAGGPDLQEVGPRVTIGSQDLTQELHTKGRCSIDCKLLIGTQHQGNKYRYGKSYLYGGRWKDTSRTLVPVVFPFRT